MLLGMSSLAPAVSPASDREPTTLRDVVRVIDSHQQLEGGGFLVRRPLPTRGVQHLDPFLLIDEGGPVTYGPGEAVGAPDHPHRGFETVTYVLDGGIQHEDSAGHRGELRPGDVQWMTAGAGIVHSEMPTAELLEGGGRFHIFQVWVNLPARLKLTQPRYQEVPASGIPTAETPDGLARVKLIAGSALGKSAVIETLTPIVYQDWTLAPGADVTVALDRAARVLVYVFEGEARVGTRRVHDGQLAVLGDGEEVRLSADKPARLLLLAGAPHGEPIAHYGPFVMNTQRELAEAVRDYQSGRMGEITRSARIG
jgi:redox-sensitive bicupin YhaK (pirin superfamily)